MPKGSRPRNAEVIPFKFKENASTKPESGALGHNAKCSVCKYKYINNILEDKVAKKSFVKNSLNFIKF